MLPEDQEKLKIIRKWVVAFNWDDAPYGVGVRVTVQYPLICRHYDYPSFEKALDILLKRVRYRAQSEVRLIELERHANEK